MLFLSRYLKILYLTEFLSTIGGGGEVTFYENAKRVAKNGSEVHLICHQSDARDEVEQGDLNEREGISGRLTIHKIRPKLSLKHGTFPSLLQQIFYIVSMIWNGSRLIQGHKINLIHANTLSPAIAGSILGAIHRIPVVTTIHHVHSIKSSQQRKQSHKARSTNGNKSHLQFAASELSRKIYEKIIITLPVTAIHSVSDASAQDLREFGYNGRVDVVPNGLDFDRFSSNSANKKELQYAPYLLFICRMVEYKNLDVVMEGFAMITKKLPFAKLVIIGDGPARKSWQNKALALGINRNVDFRGYVSEDEKLSLLCSCSALVFPSTIEGFGLVILEAFAFKKPTIVSDILPLKDMVHDGIDGFVLSPSKPQEWASKMGLLLQNSKLCQAMGTKGRIRTEREFDIENTAKKLEAVYRDILGKEKKMAILKTSPQGCR